ncbi:MAG: metal ABC transporter permease [Proteobacteria bacterium]|nr:metal ABC transporter permease [Pseudomonadota bacterium]
MVEPTWANFIGALDIFRDAILCGAAAGAVLGYLGVLIVLRRMVFVTAAITQSAGFGIALGMYVGIVFDVEMNLVLWAIGVSLLAAGMFAFDARKLNLSRESVLALVWLVGAGGAVLLGDRITQEAHDVSSIMFGTAVLVDQADLILVVSVGAVALGLCIWAQRGLVFAGYDPDGARVQGIPVRLLELSFLALVTLEASVATRALGALPVFAFSVLPGMAALLAMPKLKWAFPVALVGGVVAAVVGYMAAFFLSFPVGASQAAVAVLLVVVALPIKLIRG